MDKVTLVSPEGEEYQTNDPEAFHNRVARGFVPKGRKLATVEAKVIEKVNSLPPVTPTAS